MENSEGEDARWYRGLILKHRIKNYLCKYPLKINMSCENKTCSIKYSFKVIKLLLRKCCKERVSRCFPNYWDSHKVLRIFLMLLKEETSDVKVKLHLNDLLLNEESLVLLSYCCFKTCPVPGSQEVGTAKTRKPPRKWDQLRDTTRFTSTSGFFIPLFSLFSTWIGYLKLYVTVILSNTSIKV